MYPIHPPVIKALWMLCSMPTICHNSTLQCRAKRTLLVPMEIFYVTWLQWCSSKWPTIHLQKKECGFVEESTVSNHHVCITPRNGRCPNHEHVACHARVRNKTGCYVTLYVAPSGVTPSKHCILHLHPP